jgi:hypothetical protein
MHSMAGAGHFRPELILVLLPVLQVRYSLVCNQRANHNYNPEHVIANLVEREQNKVEDNNCNYCYCKDFDLREFFVHGAYVGSKG